MVPPQEHCHGERSSPQFQTQNSLWCATRPLAASFLWLVQCNSPAPSPKCPPACRSFCWVGNENRNLWETLQNEPVVPLLFSHVVGTRGRDIPWQHNDTEYRDTSTLDANDLGAPLPRVPVVLLAHTETLRRLGATKLNPLVSRFTWDLRAAKATDGSWPPSSALLPCSQMTISIKAEGSEKVLDEKLHSVIRRQVLDSHRTAPGEQTKPWGNAQPD